MENMTRDDLALCLKPGGALQLFFDALEQARSECGGSQNAMLTDPAVGLIVHKLALSFVDQGFDAQKAQVLCQDRISRRQQRPLLLQLLEGSFYYDVERKESFARETKKYLRRLAAFLDCHSGDVELRWDPGGPAVSGDICLHTDHFYISVSADLERGGPGGVLYRSCQGRKDYSGGRNHWARVPVLLDTDVFARRLVTDLRLALDLFPDKGQDRLL